MSRHAVIPPPGPVPRVPLRPDEAVIVFGCVFLAFHLGGAALRASVGPAIAPALHWLLIALPVIAFLKMRGLPLASTLRLAPPRPRAWLGTVCLSMGVVAAADLYMQAQDALLGGFAFYSERMDHWSEALTTESPLALLGLILTVGVTPAICEELLFRGMLTQAIAPWMSRLRACLLVGLLFGLFHADPLQLGPAVLIGAALTWLVLVTDSLWMPILMHFLFNLATILARHFLAGSESEGAPLWAIGLSALLALVFLPMATLLLSPGRGAPRRTGAESSAHQFSTGVNP